MERIPANPPPIQKVSPGTTRPLWSVMIPVYNSADTLVDTLTSVLMQDPGPEKMQIMVIDDCSDKDDIRLLTAKIGKGRIEYFRKDKNEGHLQNYNSCIQMAKGYYVHILHADDRLNAGFYHEMGMLLKQNPTAGAAFCRWIHLNKRGKAIGVSPLLQPSAGIVDNLLEKLVVKLRMQYVTTVVKRAVYEEVGGFYGVNYGEDWLMWCRIAANHDWVYSPKMLGQYREHGLGSMSMTSIRDGSNLSDMRFVMNKAGELLPPAKRYLADEGFKNYLSWTLEVMNSYWTKSFDTELVQQQISRVIHYCSDEQVLKKIRSLNRTMKFSAYYKAKNFIVKQLRPKTNYLINLMLNILA